MREPLISVIVPVYNVELYLNRCVDSIVNQTYQNLEIILVDDGSSDNSPFMCDAWAERDIRINVIHKVNGGLSDARNVGMSIAKGELMGFVDSDDWIAPEMYQLLYENMVENDSDISACGVKMVWEDDTLGKLLTVQGNYIFDTKGAMEAIIRESMLKQPVWYKLYKSSLVQNISFPVGKCHEDVFWSYQAVGKARCVSVFDTPCYHYYQRNGSIMGDEYSLKRLDALDAKRERLKYIELYFPQLIDTAKCELWFFGMYTLQMCLRFLSQEDMEIARGKIRKIVNDLKPVHCEKGMKIKQRIWFWLSTISFKYTCQLRNLLHIGV